MTAFDIIVVGGGAAGLMAAVCALDAGARVCVLEKLDRVGKKLLATGNGRCNITNMRAPKVGYHGDTALARDVIGRFPPCAVLDKFKSLGILCREESEGRVYPISGQAASVLDALRIRIKELGGEEITGFALARIDRTGDAFTLISKEGASVHAKRVIVATGGLAAKNLGGDGGGHRVLFALGHSATDMFPALVQLKVDPALTLPMKGLKYEGKIDLYVDGLPRQSAEGDVLFTQYGLSGPPVLELSRCAGEALRSGKTATLHLRPLNMPFDDVRAELLDRRERFPKRPLEIYLLGLVGKRIGQTLLKQAGVGPLSRRSDSLADAEIDAIASALTDHPYTITGTNSFEHAQTTAGGLNTREFDAATLESKIVPGLFAAGELLDVDGDCGGFNLQWAWSSGMLSAESALSKGRMNP